MRHHSTINGRMSRLINFLGNFIIVVLFHAASSLSPPTNSFGMLFFFSLSSIILDKRTLPYFVSKLSIFWFPPKGIKGIRVVFELFQFQSLHQRCIQFNRDRSCFVTKGGGKKKETKNLFTANNNGQNLVRRGEKKVEIFEFVSILLDARHNWR